MRWKGRKQSTNIEDRRGQRGRRRGGGAKMGGGAVLLLVIAGLFLGGDPSSLLGMLGGGGLSGPAPSASSAPSGPVNDEFGQFMSVILKDTEDTWAKVLPRDKGQRYQPPKLVLYTEGTSTDGCGYGQAAAGPFYCPADDKIYIDLGFFKQLARMGGRGDFAPAYVLSHEVAHHIQNQLGLSSRVRQLQGQVSKTDSNRLSVMVELQADCYAGVWAHHAARYRDLLEEGDIEEGLAAAAAVGDDQIMKQAGRRVRPESFTHGSAKQRKTWFMQGLRSGDMNECDTFAAG